MKTNLAYLAVRSTFPLDLTQTFNHLRENPVMFGPSDASCSVYVLMKHLTRLNFMLGTSLTYLYNTVKS